jgi:hypothetical protein
MVVSSCSHHRHQNISFVVQFEPLDRRDAERADHRCHDRKSGRAHPRRPGGAAHRGQDANARQVAVQRQRAGRVDSCFGDARDLPAAGDRAVPLGAAKRSPQLTAGEVL